MEAKGGEFEFGLQIVIQGLVRLPTLAAPAQLADGDHRLGIQGQANRAGVRVGLAIEAMHRLKDRIGLRHVRIFDLSEAVVVVKHLVATRRRSAA